jgi:outer membrane lipoprotein SlyB
MKSKQNILAGLLAVSAMLPLALLSSQAVAQGHNAAQLMPRIEGFNVDEVRRLAPGVELNFDIYGTPGGLVTLHIEGAMRNVILVETEPGQYEGTYTINSRDTIAARSPVTANLRVGNQVTSLVLNESLQVGVGYHGAKVAPGIQPSIERFRVAPIADLKGGNDLNFTLHGTPGGKVDVSITGMKGKILLPEVNNGEYASVYTIRNRDRILPNSVVTANLRLGERVTSVTLGHNLLSPSAPAQPAHVCNNCGTIEAVNMVEVKGEGTYLGTIGGGVLGAVLGNQIGSGSGRTVAQIAGAVGGAYAGRAIEGKSRTTQHYEVVVRLQNSMTQVVSFATDPGFRVGDKVKVNNGAIVRNP